MATGAGPKVYNFHQKHTQRHTHTYIEGHTRRNTHRGTHTQTHTETEGHPTERHTEKHTETPLLASPCRLPDIQFDSGANFAEQPAPDAPCGFSVMLEA